MPWGAAIGGVASLAGSALSSSAASNAANQQVAASEQALGFQQQMYAQQQQNLAPYLSGGTAANSALLRELGITDPTGEGGSDHRITTADTQDPWYQQTAAQLQAQYGANGQGNSPQDAAYNVAMTNAWNQYQAQNNPQSGQAGFGSLTSPITLASVQADPVYANGLQFGLDQGNAAINNRALAGGNYDSGATLKALSRFANDYGTSKTQAGVSDIQSNRQQQYGFLSGVANEGLSAAGAANTASANNANATSGLLTGIGNAQAAGTVGAANAYSGIGSSLGNAYNSYNNSQLLSSLVGNSNQANNSSVAGYGAGMDYINSQLAGVNG